MPHRSEKSGNGSAANTAVSCPVPEHGWPRIARETRLTRREMEIARELFQGLGEAAIADELGISVHTVHTHIHRMYRKLDVRNRSEFILRVVSTHVESNAERTERQSALAPAGRSPT